MDFCNIFIVTLMSYNKRVEVESRFKAETLDRFKDYTKNKKH